MSGKVQGVWFRDSCRQAALDLNVRGWVRNLPDGRVEAVFEGDREDIDLLIAWCGRGPAKARVTEVKVSYEPPEGLTGFEIR